MTSQPAGSVLQFDLGNTRVKWRALSGANVLARGAGSDMLATQPDWRLLDPQPQQVQVASVASPEREQSLIAAVQAAFGLVPWFARSSAAAGELRNSYAEPSRMGVDRWLGMLAARARCSRRLCVVDAGSALTIDLVSAQGVHEGGYILPGAGLMERSLLLDTQRVRFDTRVSAADRDTALAPGMNTADCVGHGIALAQVGAVHLALQHAGAPQPELFFTGGDGLRLRALLDATPSHWCPDLVFDGLGLLAEMS